MAVSDYSYARIRRTFPLVAGLLISFLPSSVAVGATFAVNSQADVIDANPGDGICRTAPANTVCTLRAAVMEANVLPGADTINLLGTTYLLTRAGEDATGVSGDLDILDSVTIVGAGPALTVIDGNSAVTSDRVLQIFRCVGNVPPLGACAAGDDVVVEISGVAVRHGVRFTDSGGGISSSGALTLSNCIVSDNAASGTQGAGIATTGSLTMVGCTVRDNVTSGSTGTAMGGGVFVFAAPVSIVGSTISGNRAQFGGGIVLDETTANLVNTTISGNASLEDGGGIFAPGGTVSLYNVTIVANQANSDDAGFGVAGGLYGASGASVTLNNSLITNNFHRNDGSPFDTLDDCGGPLISTGNNLVTSVVGAHCSIAGAFVSVGASLGPLQNNGGPTPTHALSSGSIARDAGNPLGCFDNFGAILATDQRGEVRPFGPACDLGAFELGELVFRDGFES